MFAAKARGASSTEAHALWLVLAEIEDWNDLADVRTSLEEDAVESSATMERVFDRLASPKDPIAPRLTFFEPEWTLAFKDIVKDATWTFCPARVDFVLHKTPNGKITPPCLDGGEGKCTKCGRALFGGFIVTGSAMRRQAACILAGKPKHNLFLALKPRANKASLSA